LGGRTPVRHTEQVVLSAGWPIPVGHPRMAPGPSGVADHRMAFRIRSDSDGPGPV